MVGLVDKVLAKEKNRGHNPSKTYLELLQAIYEDNLPKHIAIIMDGNGRWAKKRMLPRNIGHRYGMTALKKTVEICSDLGVGYLTIFAFSTENWSRPSEEVSFLMTLFLEYLKKEVAFLHKENVRVLALGDLDPFSNEIRKAFDDAIELTSSNTGMTLNIAVNYGSRREIGHAVKCIAQNIEQGLIKLEDVLSMDDDAITDLITQRLYTAGQPDPDIIIRSSGEMRVSNFLLWQLAYTEFYYTLVLWPDFDKKELMRAVIDYQKRQRRYGGIL